MTTLITAAKETSRERVTSRNNIEYSRPNFDIPQNQT